LRRGVISSLAVRVAPPLLLAREQLAHTQFGPQFRATHSNTHLEHVLCVLVAGGSGRCSEAGEDAARAAGRPLLLRGSRGAVDQLVVVAACGRADRDSEVPGAVPWPRAPNAATAQESWAKENCAQPCPGR